jgi:hypothetical protein
MIKKLAGETWKLLTFSRWKELRKKYAVSNYGRIASFKQDIPEDGELLSGSIVLRLQRS